jgi:dihydrofolate reductase
MSSPSPSLYSIPITSVVAVTPSWGIGKSGTVPWHCADVFLPSDLKYFRDATTHTADKSKRNAVLMGRLTWESIPLKNRWDEGLREIVRVCEIVLGVCSASVLAVYVPLSYTVLSPLTL